MTLEQFAVLLREELSKRLERLEKGQNRRIEYRVVRKNNGVKYHGILVLQEYEQVVPYIYVDRYLEEYEKGRTLSDIVSEIGRIWESQIEAAGQRVFDFSYEALKDRIVYRLVHYEKNKEELEGTPYIPLLDLAITFHVVMIQEEKEVGMFRIENNHLEQWGVTGKEVARMAAENTPRLFPSRVYAMEELLGTGDGNMPMYIITNENGINGAAAVLYPEILAELSAKLQSDLYLLPSSIHEFIAIPFREDCDGKGLREIVQEVNRSQVPEEDYLSDEVYCYDRQKSLIQMI